MKPYQKLDKHTALLHYATLMNEAKHRLASINTIAALGERGQIKRYIPAEFSYLQLRMICELICFCCLLAHDDLEIARKMRDQTSPDEILKNLAREHPGYYPRPVLFRDADGNPTDLSPEQQRFSAHPVTNRPYLSSTNLTALYGVCGNVLHRGTLQRLTTKGSPEMAFQNIEDWLSRCTNLLVSHEVRFADGQTGIWCSFGANVEAEVAVVHFKIG